MLAPERAEQLRGWLALIRVPGLGPGGARRLLQSWGEPAAVLAAGAAAWRGAGVSDDICRGL